MKNYIKKVLKLYNFNNLVIESIALGVFIILIDRFDLISLCLNNNLILIVVLLAICFLVKIINKRNFKKINLCSISELDKYLIEYSFLFSLLVLYTLLFDYKYYKIAMLSVSLLLYLIIVVIRIIRNKAQEKHINNVLDLKDICSGKIDLKDYDEMVLIEESDVKYDLLNRTAIINNLYNVVVRSFPSKSFTIGLNGKWGSGKTTIINNVLNKMDINKESSKYLIVKFDPWMFNDEKTMLESFLDKILNTMNFNISVSNKNEIIQEVITSIFPSNYHSLIKYILNEIRSPKVQPDITNIVNDYLESNKKKLLIIIDNLDRIDGEKALFLIKCLDTVLNFENTINILLYDEEIINNVLNDKFNFSAKYMEKLVQLKVEIPIIDKYTLDNIKNVVSTNLVYNGKRIIAFGNEELYEFDNLRELKRYMNSIISLTIDTHSELNSNDYTLLKYIQLKCPELYYEIWNNKKYYVLYDRRYDSELYTFDYSTLNKKAKDYFNKLYQVEKYKEYLKYVEKIFPNMANSKKTNYDIFSNYINESEYSESVLNNRASNARYFSYYFTDEENDFMRLKKDVVESLSQINESDDFFNELESKIKSYNPDELKVFLEIFYLSMDGVSKDKSFVLLNCLTSLLPYTKNRIMFAELDSKQRLFVIIAKLLSQITKTEYSKYKKQYINNYKELSTISSIKYWIDANKEKGINYNFDFEELYNDLCFSILNKNIDIYNANNYMRGNVWALYHYNDDQTRNYLKTIVDERNIFLLLNDLISVSSGTGGYGYSITTENINLLIPEIDIEKLLTKKNLTEKEKFIKKVYKESINQKDKFKKGIYLEEYIEL